MKRRHFKPRTAAGLTHHHLGMTVEIDGGHWRVLSVSHRRGWVEVFVEWPDLGDDEKPGPDGRGHLVLDPGERVTVADWNVRFRPSFGERLKAARVKGEAGG